MVDQNNVYQLKRLVAKMTGTTPDKVSGNTTAGSSAGKTLFHVTEPLQAGNKYRIKANGLACVYNYDLSEYGDEWDGVSEVSATYDQSFMIYECTTDNRCRGFGKCTAVIPE